MGEVELDENYVEARNNIFAGSERFTADGESNNLFADTDLKFTQLPNQKAQAKLFKAIPNFTPQSDSPAIDAGINIPEITPDFTGKSPDIGAYERNAPAWQAGSSLKYNP